MIIRLLLLLNTVCWISCGTANPGSSSSSSTLVKNIREIPFVASTYEFSQDDELDLHSKKISTARELIQNFLHNAHQMGKKFVLIITGKGRHSKETFRLDDGTEAGPIKYNFLKWCQQGVFSTIQKVSYAHSTHGGEGAFYIQLKP